MPLVKRGDKTDCSRLIRRHRSLSVIVVSIPGCNPQRLAQQVIMRRDFSAGEETGCSPDEI
jgi:hypothetical protein